MPKVTQQDMFPMEQCNKCDKDGELYKTLRGRYMWRCPQCTGTWRTLGTQLAFFNAMHGRVDYNIPVRGLIIEEKK